MIVALDAMALGSGRGGDETYTRGLLAGLAELVVDGGTDVFPLLMAPQAEVPDAVRAHPSFPVLRVPGRGRAFRHAVTMRRAIASCQPPIDLAHLLIHAPPWPPRPVALYVPDLSFLRMPDLHSWQVRLRLSVLVPLHVRQARVIITLSDYSRRDIIKAYRVEPERVFVVPCAVSTSRPQTGNSAERDVEGEASWRAKGVHRPYFLYLGNLHPLKNVRRLIHAFCEARRATDALRNHQLVIAGARWWGRGEEEAARGADPGTIVFLGRVSDDERDALLRNAIALVYPSLFEGFGLPPVEAMAAGTPVVASNATSLPEVLGSAAEFVDPLSVDAIAAGLTRVATDESLRARLREQGLLQAAKYTPKRMAESAMAAFQWAVAHRG